MNEQKLKQMLNAVRRESPPQPPADFERSVMQAVRREPAPATRTLLEELNRLFPRLVWGAVCLIAVCVASDYAAGLPSLSDGVAQLSQQWFFDGGGL